MRSRKIIWLSVFISAVAAFGQANLSPDVKNALDSIQPQNAYLYCRTISSAQFQGRLTGHEGYTAAAKWAASKFKEWGLKPAGGKDGYLLPYPSPYVVIDKADMSLSVYEKPAAPQKEPTWKETKLEPLKDFLPLFFSDAGRNVGEIVFAGWGISAPEIGYDDYAGLDVKGKFVMCFRGTPDPRDTRYTDHDQHRTRMSTAKKKGALGIVYIYPAPLSNPNGDWIQGFTPAIISEKVADLILKEIGVASSELQKDLLIFKKPISFPLHSKIDFKVEAKNFPDGVGYNIAGYLEGSDPQLKKDVIIVGGHFDHDGQQMGFLFPGAYDNASGSAVVMETARAFSKLARKPKRSVLFVLFGGEEKGLQGSTYLADHLPAMFAKTDTMFNYDMEGEGDGAYCSIGPENAALIKALQDADSRVNILRSTSVIRNVGVRGSDFAPFFLKGVTAVSIGSNGPDPNYHLPGDTIYRINPEIMYDICRVSFLAAFFWADR